MKPIHGCGDSNQPDINILCIGWTTPKWGSDEECNTGIANVYLSDEDDLYTFDDTLVTCEKCKLF